MMGFHCHIIRAWMINSEAARPRVYEVPKLDLTCQWHHVMPHMINRIWIPLSLSFVIDRLLLHTLYSFN